ncbi:hypothetical protein C1T17_17945 [Sphingobium sp. SCG-1]|uniref:acyl-CoA dehydrogenase family protein n=1 Tax=Sphingobium sp. SCG-1 TaxID=2072936 RepID=UPI000CD69941|nr:acyl-CoA dehydrogenase [Sphingobium sp. SCG-1]AUW59687.1 hypothetical protein C1T17_17945 [Sphingobium sp. SCG-1]
MMVDFSLTEADVRLMDMARAERAAARTVSREIDRIPESETMANEDHAVVAGTVSPHAALKAEKEPISGPYITECLMTMVGHHEFTTRPAPEPFGSWIVNEFGDPAQVEAYGKYRLVIGISEPSAGADPSATTTSARYDAETDEWILNGEKIFISNINRSEGAVVLAKGEPDASGKRPFFNFVVLNETRGFKLTPPMRKLGIHYHDLGGFVMEDVRVPSLAKLERGFVNVQARFNHNRPVIAALGVGMVRSLLDFTHGKLAESGIKVDYAKGRLARSYAEDKLIRMEALWEAAWSVIMRVKWLEEQLGKGALELQTESAIAKAMGGKATRQISQGCMELLGAEGISEEYLAEKWFRDARITDIYEGPGEIHRLTIARKLLGYKKGELD